MRLIIAGGRDYWLTDQDRARLDTINNVTEVVSGHARGVDRCGEEWARSRNIPVKVFPADWARDGKGAGFIRNKQMAEYADAVALFPGGRGTQNMFIQAKRLHLKIFDFRRSAIPA